jgi:hypothetical protein
MWADSPVAVSYLDDRGILSLPYQGLFRKPLSISALLIFSYSGLGVALLVPMGESIICLLIVVLLIVWPLIWSRYL